MNMFSEHFLNLLRSGNPLLNGSALQGGKLEEFHRWVCNQPKIETHVHLEAAVGRSFYEDRPHPDDWKIRLPWKRVPFANLREFIFAWIDLSKSISELKDFELMAEMFVEQRSMDHIYYTEAYISPADFSFIRRRFSIASSVFEFEKVIRAYIRGLQRGIEKYPEVDIRLIVDSLWIANDEERSITLKSLANILHDSDCCDSRGQPFIVAVGLGGSETHANLFDQIRFFEKARHLGLKVDIHSGEGGEPDMHLKSIQLLQPDRVAHGFSAFSEGYIFENNLVMCPLSNLTLNTFQGEPYEHPVFACLERGIPIGIGSDDPLLFETSLAHEYTFLHSVTQRGIEIFESTQKDMRERVLAPRALEQIQHSRLKMSGCQGNDRFQR